MFGLHGKPYLNYTLNEGWDEMLRPRGDAVMEAASVALSQCCGFTVARLLAFVVWPPASALQRGSCLPVSRLPEGLRSAQHTGLRSPIVAAALALVRAVVPIALKVALALCARCRRSPHLLSGSLTTFSRAACPSWPSMRE